MKKLILSICVLLSAVGFAFSRQRAVTMTQGNLRLTVFPETNSFVLYYLADPARNKFLPMFSSLDPRTSSMKIRLGDKILDLSDTSVFTTELTYDANTATLTYFSEEISAIQSFSFVKSAFATTPEEFATGVLVEWSIKYIGEKKINAGMRFVLDTNLGEGLGMHFRTDAHPRVSTELRLDEKSSDTYLISGEKDSALLVQFSGTGFAKPQSVVFANWKRIDSAVWDYTLLEGRNFNLLPYSVNDSAVAFYWPSKQIENGGELYANLVLGLASSGGFGKINRRLPLVKTDTSQVLDDVSSELSTENSEEETEAPAIIPVEEPKTPSSDAIVDSGRQPVTAEAPIKTLTDEEIKNMAIDEIIDRLDFLLHNPNLATEDEVDRLNTALLKLVL